MSRVDLHRALSVRACLPVLGWCLLGLCLGLPAWGQRSVPVEVEKRTESGDIKQIQELLLEENPEYARLSFGDALNATTKWSRGWESWWSSDGARFFVYKRNPMDEKGYLYLDGATNWVVHDLVSMRDNVDGMLEEFNYGAYPTVHNEAFYLVGGYGLYRYHRKWLKLERRRFTPLPNYGGRKKLSEKYLEAPEVVHGMWRDDERQSYFMIANPWVYEEPNLPPPYTKQLSDTLTSGLNQFQLWQMRDKGSAECLHVSDLNPDVLTEIPLAVLESESWVIFIRPNSTSTPMMRKSDFAWFELKGDHQLPFGTKTGLYGWMFEGDTLMVVDNGTVTDRIDLTEHVANHQSMQPQFVEAQTALQIPPVSLSYVTEAPGNGSPWGWPLGVALVLTGGLLAVVVSQRKKQGQGELELSDMQTQLEIIEYFSRSIFRSNSAEDILWDIAAQCISRLDFEDCVIYMLDEQNNQWIQKAAYGPKNINYRQIHEPVTLGLTEGIVGAVGLSGQAEIIPDVRKDTRYVLDDEQRLSEMAVPIVCDGKVIGVIDSEHSEADFYTRDHLKIIQNVANICGQKLGRSLSEQKTLEFIQVYEQNPDPVMRVDKNGVVVMTSDSAKAHFGRIALQGEQVKIPDLLALVESTVASGKAEVASIRSGSRIYQVHALPKPDKTLVDIYATDVTDLERSRIRAEKAERAKADFLSVMSHEIRTPLNAILGINELMLREDLEDDQMRQLKYMRYSGKHLLGLVNNILNLETLDRADVERKTSNFNLTSLLTDLAESLRPRIEEGGCKLTLNLTNEGHAWVQGDRHWVAQMVSNLLDNARKFTKKGTVTLSAKALPGTDSWMIEVEDTGIGIAENHLQRIMDPFEQILNNPKNTSPDQGTGLGLAIVKRLAALHGGTLSVHSTEGIGSKFTLELELPKGTPEARPSAPSNTSGPAKGPVKGDSDPREVKVLVVDDNPINLMVAKKLIQQLGHEVVTAEDGLLAIQAWQNEQPEMIFMDLQMPQMDGLDATREIRKIIADEGRPSIGIVALTADAEPSTKKDALDAGLDDVLVKPASLDQLDHSINQWSQAHR